MTGEPGIGRWPCEPRRQLEVARALRARLAELEEEIALRASMRPSAALLEAAAAPEQPAPHMVITLPVEGTPEVDFVAADPGELARLVDWLEHGPHSPIGDHLRSLSGQE